MANRRKQVRASARGVEEGLGTQSKINEHMVCISIGGAIASGTKEQLGISNYIFLYICY